MASRFDALASASPGSEMWKSNSPPCAARRSTPSRSRSLISPRSRARCRAARRSCPPGARRAARLRRSRRPRLLDVDRRRQRGETVAVGERRLHELADLLVNASSPEGVQRCTGRGACHGVGVPRGRRLPGWRGRAVCAQALAPRGAPRSRSMVRGRGRRRWSTCPLDVGVAHACGHAQVVSASTEWANEGRIAALADPQLRDGVRRSSASGSARRRSGQSSRSATTTSSGRNPRLRGPRPAASGAPARSPRDGGS